MSSLAWGGAFRPDLAEQLAVLGIQGVEVAPTALTSDGSLPDVADAAGMAARWSDLGLGVSGLQSLLFGRPDLQLFDRQCWPALRERLAQTARLTSAMHGDVAVFGSPRNRLRDDLPMSTALDMAAEFFIGVAPTFEAEGVVLTLEPNPTAYGADFLTTYEQVAALASLVGSDVVRPQVDTGCLMLAGVDPAEAVREAVPAHVHVSAPGLGPVPDPQTPHVRVREALLSGGYQGWVTLEMLSDRLPGGAGLLESAAWLVDCYRDGRCGGG